MHSFSLSLSLSLSLSRSLFIPCFLFLSLNLSFSLFFSLFLSFSLFLFLSLSFSLSKSSPPNANLWAFSSLLISFFQNFDYNLSYISKTTHSIQNSIDSKIKVNSSINFTFHITLARAYSIWKFDSFILFTPSKLEIIHRKLSTEIFETRKSHSSSNKKTKIILIKL